MNEEETEPSRPNRTEPGNFRRRPELDAETNRTEPDRATTRPKSAGWSALNREMYFSEPNRTEPNRLIFERQVRNRNESNRIGSFLSSALPRSVP